LHNEVLDLGFLQWGEDRQALQVKAAAAVALEQLLFRLCQLLLLLQLPVSLHHIRDIQIYSV
jgi:hypothetical protein